MSVYRGLDAPKGPGYYLFWKAVFVVLLLGMAAFVWAASSSVEHVWQWSRIPQYFWMDERVEIRAEQEGTLQDVLVTNGISVVVLQEDDGTKVRQVLRSDSTVIPVQGDYVYVGDVLGVYDHSAPGVLLQGLWITLKVSLVSIIFGIIFGVLTGLARISENPALKWGAIGYIECIRGSPLLVQIFLWYFVAGTLVNSLLQQVGLGVVPPLWFGVLALSVFTGAYVGEIVRAGIQSVHRGQMEAARSLGLTYGQAMRKVILPQAFRRIMPPLAGQFISLVKDSSLLGVIAIRELTKATREVVSSSLQPFELWILCALLYLLLTFTLSLFVSYLESRAVR